MTTPEWESKIQALIDIDKPAPPKRPEGSIALTSAHLDTLLGQNANPYCGPTAVWWFTADEYPFRGRGELWRRAERLNKQGVVTNEPN